ncbi:MAG: S-layer homology domain-containing protein [Patescibacteria group bacterium]
MSILLKKVTSTVSALTVVVASVSSTLSVSAASEFATYAEALAQAGVLNTQATEAGYRLGDNVTRAELAKIAVKLSGGETATCAGNVFSDVTSKLGDLCGYVEAAADAGIVSKANSKFRPADLVTRAEMVKMLLAATGVAPTNVSAGFSDVTASLGDLAGYINAGVEEGCVKAGSMFRPNATSTRGEAFKIAACVAGLTDTTTPPVNNGTGTTNTGTTNTGTTNTGTTTPPVVIASGSLSVAVNPATPAATTLATGSAYNKILAVDLTAGSADAAVTGFEVTRTGLISNTNISGVSAWVDGARVGNVVQSLTADGKATLGFSSTPITIKAGTTKTVTFAVNLKALDYSGTVGLTVSKVISGGTVTGTPVSSNTHSVVNGASSLVSYNVGSIAVGGYSMPVGNTAPATPTLLDIGQTTELAKVKFTQNNSKEDLSIEGMNIFVDGSVSDGDLTGFEVWSQEGTKLASAVSAAGRYVNFKFATPYVIPQGGTRYVTVKATVASGKYNSGRNFSVRIRDDFDIIARGLTTGTYILASNSSNLLDNQYWFGINSGDLTISKATDSRSSNVGANADDVALATFDVKASGEDIEVQKLNFIVTKGSGAVDLRGTIKITANGQTVYSTDAGNSVNYTTGGNAGYLSTYVTVKAGTTAKFVILGSTAAGSADNAGVNGRVNSYKVSIKDLSYKLTSSNTISSKAGPYEANLVTVESTTLAVSGNGAFNAVNVVKGQSQAKIGSFNIQASNADDVNVNTVVVSLTSTGGLTGINNLTLKSGAKQLGNVISNPSASGNSFSVNSGDLKVAKNSTVTVDVYADITSATTADNVTAVVASVTGVGATNSVTVTGTPASVSSTRVTVVGNGTLTVANDSLTPGKQILTAGLTNKEVFRFQVKASNNEDIRLDKITLGSGSVSTTATNLGKNFLNVKLYDGATQLGGSVTFVGGEAKFTGLGYIVPKGSTKSLSVRVDTASSGVLENNTVVDLKPSQVEYTGVAGGQLYALNTPSGSAVSNTMLLQDVKVVIASTMASSASKTVGSTNQDIGAYTITADGSRDITLNSIKVKISGSAVAGGPGATISNVRLRYNNTDYVADSYSSGVAIFSTVLGSGFNITAGSSISFTVRADTSTVAPQANATLTLGTSIEGTSGVANVANSVVYSYKDVNGTDFANVNTSDSYPVAGATLQY